MTLIKDLKFYVLTMEKRNTEIVLEKGKLSDCQKRLNEIAGYVVNENPIAIDGAIYSIIEGEIYVIKKRIEKRIMNKWSIENNPEKI